MSGDLNIDDVTWVYTLDRVLKNSTTGLITEIKYTFTGTYGDYTASVPNNYAALPPSDPSATGFISIDDVTPDDVIAWVDATASECPEFDIEQARVKEPVPGLALDDPRQPYNQDLSGFRFSSYKEQMQKTITASLNCQIADAEGQNAVAEHVF